MTKRRQARELVLKGLYAYEILQRVVQEIFEDLSSGGTLTEEHLKLARQYMRTVVKNLDFLDEELIRLVENWEIERIALMDKIILQIFEDLSSESTLAEEHLKFARHYMETVIKNFEFLDSEITRLAENWEIERIALMDKIILRMALCEIHFMPDIPEKVAINEAIDLAKQYSTMESSAFVNGILDAAISGSSSSSKK